MGEHPDEIKAYCEKLGLQHFHVDVHSAAVSHLTNMMASEAALNKFVQSILQLIEIMSSREESVLIHCHAGYHRTGMTAYTLIRMLSGRNPDDAYKALQDMRKETYENVGNERLELIEKFVIPRLTNAKKII